MTASQPGNCSSSQTQGGHIAFVRQDHKPGHAPLYLIRNRSYIIFTSNRSLEPRTLHSEMQYASVLRISLEIVGVWVLAYGGRLQAIQAIHSLSSSVNGSNDQSWVIAAPVTMLTTVHGIHFATYVLEFCFFIPRRLCWPSEAKACDFVYQISGALVHCIMSCTKFQDTVVWSWYERCSILYSDMVGKIGGLVVNIWDLRTQPYNEWWDKWG